MRIYREVDLSAFRKFATSSATNANAFVGKPPDALVIRSLSYQTTGTTTNNLILQKDDSFIKDYWPDRTQTGVPRYYADWDATTIILAPTPNANFTLEMAYTFVPQSVVTAGDTWVSDNASDALFAASMLEALRFMKAEQQDIGAAGSQNPGVWSQNYTEAITRLRGELVRMRTDEYRAGEIRG